MPIQLDKILSDIAKEKNLQPYNPASIPKTEIDAAWIRVGKKNNLSVHEVRSIFKVLQKKYEQEKLKDRSGWKLFPILDEIHQTGKQDSADEEPLPMEEDEEYEMLEVQEEEDQQQAVSSDSIISGQAHSSGGEASDSESPTKSAKSERSSRSGSPERFEKQSPATQTAITTTTTMNTATPQRDEKKLLNSLISSGSRINSSTAAALQKKGITVKKTTINGPNNNKTPVNKPSSQQNKSIISNGNQLLTVGKTIQLPETLKRKLSEDQLMTTLSKKQAVSNKQTSPKALLAANTTQGNGNGNEGEKQTMSPTSNGANNSNGAPKSNDATSANPVTSHHGINLITIPANDVSGSLIVNGSALATQSDATSSTSSPRIEDIDFRNDIIFDTSMVGEQISITTNGKQLPKASTTNGINEEKQLELGNSDSILPRTFFKNLCNSTRYESFGLYVANSMNRLDQRFASRLETKILRAIIDAQNESLGGDS